MKKKKKKWFYLTLEDFMPNPCPAEPGCTLIFTNSVDPDQLASEEANWSVSALFAIKYMNL